MLQRNRFQLMLSLCLFRAMFNEDGAVDVSDITTIAAYILGQNPSPFNAGNADVNSDNSIDVSDITATAGMILGTN